MPDQTLIMLVTEVRNKTLKLIEGLSHDDAMGVAPGMQNSILYHAGHGVAVQEFLGVARIEKREPKLPAGFEAFMWKTEPGKTVTWPSIDVVRHELTTQRDKLKSLLEAMNESESASRLDEIVNPERGTTLRYSILHGLHDEANHQGEIWLIRKLLGLRS